MWPAGLDQIPALCAALNPTLGTGDRGGNTLAFGVNERAIRVDTLTVTLEIVQTGEAALARVVWAHVRLGTRRVVCLRVGLGRQRHGTGRFTYFEVEGSREAPTAHVTFVTLLGVIGR